MYFVFSEQQMQQQHGGGPPSGGMHPPFMMPPGFPGGPTNPNDAWQEFTSQDGKKYYYNFLTRENTWTKPKALIDREAAARENGGAPPGFPGGVPMMGGAAMSPMGIGYAGFRPSAATGGPQAALTNPQGGHKDKSRPVTSNAVAGTPWCVVWTGDNRVFFFNPSTRTSVWERPPELYNRPDVDLLVSKPPPAKEQLSNRAQKRLQKEESEEEVDDDDEVEVQSDTSNSDEEQKKKVKANPPKKKSRRDKRVEEELKMQLDNTKQPKLALPVLQQEKPIDPAIQAELEAQKERDKVPLEERIKQFRQLLEDKKVSATSTWEKELSKIVFDQRYLLLSAVERKAAFDAYCRERAEIEKEEKRKKAKEAKAEFYKLLEEAKLHGKSTFSSFSTNSKWAKDSRFKAVEKVRDREAYFKDFVEQLYKKEKEEKRKEREKAKECFVALLKEQEYLRRNSVWAVVKKKLDKDERYRNKNLDSETRQKLFDEHVKTCPEPTEEEEAEAKRVEEEALEAANAAKEKALNEKHENEERDRERRKSNSSNINNSSSSRRREKEKNEKIVEKTAEEKALEDRKRQVEEELGEHLKERNREHERHKLLEHEQNFKALLMDLVRSTDISWHDGRKLLKKDSRYQNCDLLDKESKERHFREHIRDLERKKRDVFFQLLDEHQLITFTTKWHNARKTIAEDEKFAKLKIDERKLEYEYRDWMERRHRQALDDFEALLRETKIITYKSKQMITENEQHLRDILAVLENDSRYLVLKERPSERERILDEYLDLLDRKGPPPPPTRNEDPDRRRK
uniref:Transcription elongation regulator 1 n=1 Tax=Meloidogyne hapla TaxID=6305 RepID=A0A1I8BEE2_MELHA